VKRLRPTQRLVLGFLAVAWLSLLVILAVAPEVYDQALKLPPGRHLLVDGLFLAALTAFLVALAVGIVRRWRWIFWLILVAFLAGVLRVPAALLELTGVLPASGPAWYTVFQAVVGVVQFAIGLAMLRGFRRSGIWG
jgi:hypothetical protein